MAPEQEFALLRELNETGLCEYLATRIRRERRKAGLSQAEFAASAGISLRTYKRFETHGQGTLETFLRALKTLGRARNLYLLFPQPLPTRKPTLEERIEAMAQRQKLPGWIEFLSFVFRFSREPGVQGFRAIIWRYVHPHRAERDKCITPALRRRLA